MLKTQLQWLIRLAYILFLIYAFFFIQNPYDFIFLNTLLAYIPIELAFHLSNQRPKNNVLFSLLFIIWLLFYPNNPYLLTDLFHLTLLHPYNHVTMLIRGDMQMWLYFCYLVGITLFSTILGLATLKNVVYSFTQRFCKGHRFAGYIVLEAIFFISSIGIYIGRFLRLHTVYLLDPKAILRPLLHMWHISSFQFFGMMFCLLNLIYLAIWLFKKLSAVDQSTA